MCVIDVPIGTTEAEKTRAAEVLCQLFEIALPQAQLEAKKLPPLYKSGVKYISQAPNACAFRCPQDVYDRKGGDCKQLVLWKLAELRNAGEPAKPRIIWLADKAGLRAHAQVRRADRSIEDPSMVLGMKQP